MTVNNLQKFRDLPELGFSRVSGGHAGDGCLCLCPAALVQQVHHADVSLCEHPGGGVLPMCREPLAGVLQHLPCQLVVSLHRTQGKPHENRSCDLSWCSAESPDFFYVLSKS